MRSSGKQKQPATPDEPNETEGTGSYELRRYLLILATLAANLAYQASLPPPGSNRKDSGGNETLSFRRSSLSLSAAGQGPFAAVNTDVQGASGNHGSNHPNPGPPPWASMAHELRSFRQQEPPDNCLHQGFPCDVDNLSENVMKARRMIQELNNMTEEAECLLQLMRCYANQSHYVDNQPRPDEAGPSGHAHTIDEERPGQAHKLKLGFHGSLKSRIYTNTPLHHQSNGAIVIAIFSDDQPITSGPLASLTVEIVALERDHTCKGDWTEEDFDRQIRKSRDGQGSVLGGGCLLKLDNGKAARSLGNLRFKEGSTATRSREFVLAARVCTSENIGGPRVEEAFMHPPFMVLVERSRANEKSSLPKLNSKVHDLKGIARHGAYDKRLQDEKIYNVQGFLKALNKDPDKLRRILGMRSQSSWNAVVRHARECDLRDSQLKSYKVELENVTLFFNCVDDLVGAEFHDGFVAKEKFGERQKVLVDMQLTQAYTKLDGIEFDYVMEGNYPVKINTTINAAGSPSIPILLGATTQNSPAHQATFQAENLSSYGCGIDCAPDFPLGDANCSAAGQSASVPSHQGVCQNGIPQGGSIWIDTASADVDMDDIWDFVEEPQQTNCSSGGTTATPCIPPFSPNGHGSERTNGEPDRLSFDQLGIPASDLLDESIHGFGDGGEFQRD